jgi:hypothetical protein
MRPPPSGSRRKVRRAVRSAIAACVSTCASLGCSTDVPNAPAAVQVTVPAAGSQASNVAGASGTDPACVDGVWRLAPGFLVAHQVDYVADRDDEPSGTAAAQTEIPRTLSFAGVACANASDVERCRRALLEPNPGRHLLTTAGDSVKIWSAMFARELLGRLDTPSEVLWWVSVTPQFRTPCDATVHEHDAGYLVSGLEPSRECVPPGTVPEKISVVVGADGSREQIAGAPVCGQQ